MPFANFRIIIKFNVIKNSRIINSINCKNSENKNKNNIDLNKLFYFILNIYF